MSNAIDQRLAALGRVLPDAPAPIANYKPFHRAGALLFISGQLSRTATGTLIAGRLGENLDIIAGRAAAEACALNLLSQAKAALGSLDRVTQIVN